MTGRSGGGVVLTAAKTRLLNFVSHPQGPSWIEGPFCCPHRTPSRPALFLTGMQNALRLMSGPNS